MLSGIWPEPQGKLRSDGEGTCINSWWSLSTMTSSMYNTLLGISGNRVTASNKAVLVCVLLQNRMRVLREAFNESPEPAEVDGTDCGETNTAGGAMSLVIVSARRRITAPLVTSTTCSAVSSQFLNYKWAFSATHLFPSLFNFSGSYLISATIFA